MLDRKLNPWLLEVNLSPACAERTDWLVNMLDRMASGLFDKLERKIYRVTDDFRGDIKEYLANKRKTKDSEADWIPIYDQTKNSKNYRNHMKQIRAQNNKAGQFNNLLLSAQEGSTHRQFAMPDNSAQ